MGGESPVTAMKEAIIGRGSIQDGETLENALRRFKRKVVQEDILKEVKRHAFYLKPGQKKRIKSALARKRNRKKRNRDIAQNDIR
jgi:small subunit ribosomal protein S21